MLGFYLICGIVLGVYIEVAYNKYVKECKEYWKDNIAMLNKHIDELKYGDEERSPPLR